MKISACLVVHNEEKLIRRALDSVKRVADEIIVLHDGPCKDKTLEIARQYTRKIYVRPFAGVADFHRPFCYKKATGDWILVVDADEYLSAAAQKSLRKLLARTDADAVLLAFEVPYGSRILPRRGLGKAYKRSVFRNRKWQFDGTLHGWVSVPGRVEKTELLLHHRPLANNYTWASFRRKWVQWARLQARQQVERGRAQQPALMYLFTAPLRGVFYFLFFFKAGVVNGFAGLKISVLQGIYNFLVPWYVFLEKLRQ